MKQRKTWKRLRKASTRLVGCEVRLRKRSEDRRISTIRAIMPQTIYPGGLQLEAPLAEFVYWNIADLEVRR